MFIGSLVNNPSNISGPSIENVIKFFFDDEHHREKVFEDIKLQLRTLDAAEFITSNEENDIENGISEQCLHNAIKILKQKRQNQLNVSFGRTF